MAKLQEKQHQLNVDCKRYHSPKSRQSAEFYTVIYDIKLPTHIVHDPELRWNTLERIRNLLYQDFNGGVSVFFQISGTYLLVHSKSEKTTECVGLIQEDIFNPLIHQEYELFDRNTFVDKVFPILQNVEEKLGWTGKDNKWRFDQLQYININCKSIVFKSHSILRNRNLKRELQNTFNLP
jgi:hypothetical protein